MAFEYTRRPGSLDKISYAHIHPVQFARACISYYFASSTSSFVPFFLYSASIVRRDSTATDIQYTRSRSTWQLLLSLWDVTAARFYTYPRVYSLKRGKTRNSLISSKCIALGHSYIDREWGITIYILRNN